MNEKSKPRQLRVKAGSPVGSLAGSICNIILEDRESVEIRAIGAAAINQAVKALAVASGNLATRAYSLSFKVGFDTTQIDGENKTVVVFRTEVN